MEHLYICSNHESLGLTIQEVFCLQELVFAMILSVIPNGHALVLRKSENLKKKESVKSNSLFVLIFPLL